MKAHCGGLKDTNRHTNRTTNRTQTETQTSTITKLNKTKLNNDVVSNSTDKIYNMCIKNSLTQG
jgi:hypothetical protein